MKRQRYSGFLVVAIGLFILFNCAIEVIGQTVKPVLAVLNKNEATLSVIDPVKLAAIGKVPTGSGPHEVVISPDGKTAYVANYGTQTPGSSLSIIDLVTLKEVRRVDLSPLMRPHGIQLLGGKLYFTAEVNRAIARYDPAANKVDWIMGTGQNGSHMLAVSSDQKRIYTGNIGSNSITAFDLQNVPPAASKIDHIAVSQQPEAIALSPDGKELWAASNVDGVIDVIDTAAGKLKEKIKVGGRAYRVVFSPDGKITVNTMIASKELLVIDAASKKEIKRIKLESVPLGLAFSADGKTVFVSAVQPDTILKIDLAKGEVAGKLEAGPGPDGIAVAGF